MTDAYFLDATIKYSCRMALSYPKLLLYCYTIASFKYYNTCIVI